MSNNTIPFKMPGLAKQKINVQNPLHPAKKHSFGLYGNTWSFPNAGKFRPRYYTLSDTAQGLDTLSRELLVRYSREMYGQLPFVQSAIKTLSDFTIGNAYQPLYSGNNKQWWSIVQEWLMEEVYPNASVRGMDFLTSLRTECSLLDIDGDYLCVYGMESGLPKFQIIQNNRISSGIGDQKVVPEGQPFAGMILSDGVYYNKQGKAVGYYIKSADNLVNTFTNQTEDKSISARDAHLIFDPRYIDKLRGIPSIGTACLQALSVQELDSYLMEKCKIESTIALVEQTPSGEAPLELQQTLEALQAQSDSYGTAYTISPNVHAVEVRNGGEIRYIHAEGGDLKTLANTGPGNQMADYMARLETQILSTIGVPHQLVYSTDKTSGRITSGVAEMFRSAIERRQAIVDKRAKFYISWAISKGMELGIIPENYDENIIKNISFTHPPDFTLDQKYESQLVINQYESGFSTFEDATNKLYNRSAEETLELQKKEQIIFYKKAQEVAQETGLDLNTVIAGWRYNIKVPAPIESTPESTPVE